MVHTSGGSRLLLITPRGKSDKLVLFIMIQDRPEEAI